MKSYERKLGPKDIKLFDFLWRWKLGTPLLLYEALEKDHISFRRFWQRLRRLYREGYLEIESGLCHQDLTLYRLSKVGFEQVLKSTDYLPAKRFKPQAVYHDYLATCFQLLSSYNCKTKQIQHWTEQEASIHDIGHFPEWVPGRKEHIPDGYTMIQNGKEKTLIAIEIEISQKPQPRYLKMLSFFGGSKSEYDFVFWLVQTRRLAEKILASKQGPDFMDLSKHQFFLHCDFIKSGWTTKCFLGTTKGKTLREIYQILLGHSSESQACHTWVTAESLSIENICFSSVISPRGYNGLYDKLNLSKMPTPS